MINFNSFKKKDSQKNQNGNTQNNTKEDSIIEETVIEETQVEEGKKPTIAESATKNKLLIIPIFLVAIFLVYTLFIKDAFKAPPGQEKIEPVSDKGEVAPKIEKKRG
jgi:Fe2+ transport system protein B